MEIIGKEREVPPLHGKDLVQQEKEPSLLQKILTCISKGMTTGKWEWDLTIKF